MLLELQTSGSHVGFWRGLSDQKLLIAWENVASWEGFVLVQENPILIERISGFMSLKFWRISGVHFLHSRRTWIIDPSIVRGYLWFIFAEDVAGRKGVVLAKQNLIFIEPSSRY